MLRLIITVFLLYAGFSAPVFAKDMGRVSAPTSQTVAADAVDKNSSNASSTATPKPEKSNSAS